jgi:hypothetical protein
VAALDALWGSWRSRWRRLLSRHAITELTLRASFDLDLLAPERIASRVPLGMVPDCPSCQDVCCAGVENVVSLRLRDVAVLIDLGRTELIQRKKPHFPPAVAASRPMLAELTASALWRTLPVMQQVGEDRVCAALTERLSCSLHPDWPLSCARFPYSLVAARREIVWGTRCEPRRMASDEVPRSKAMRQAAVDVYNERIRDAVLLAHARPQLEALGIGRFLIAPDEDPFESREPAPRTRLPIIG